MRLKNFTQNLQIEPIGNYYVKIVIGDSTHLILAEDLYFALLAALASKKPETIKVITSSTTRYSPLLAQNSPKVGRSRRKIIKN